MRPDEGHSGGALRQRPRPPGARAQQPLPPPIHTTLHNRHLQLPPENQTAQDHRRQESVPARKAAHPVPDRRDPPADGPAQVEKPAEFGRHLLQ